MIECFSVEEMGGVEGEPSVFTIVLQGGWPGGCEILLGRVGGGGEREVSLLGIEQ